MTANLNHIWCHRNATAFQGDPDCDSNVSAIAATMRQAMNVFAFASRPARVATSLLVFLSLQACPPHAYSRMYFTTSFFFVVVASLQPRRLFHPLAALSLSLLLFEREGVSARRPSSILQASCFLQEVALTIYPPFCITWYYRPLSSHRNAFLLLIEEA